MAQDHPETTLELARRRVAQGEARCTRQREILGEMAADNHPGTAAAAERLLAAMARTLAAMREHLRQEEELRGRDGGAA
jgi:hypothetical protein